MNKENRHTTRTVVAKRGSVVLAPVPTAREPRRPRSQQTDAVLQLVTAVKDHLRFRQLATYAVDTFSKSRRRRTRIGGLTGSGFGRGCGQCGSECIGRPRRRQGRARRLRDVSRTTGRRRAARVANRGRGRRAQRAAGVRPVPGLRCVCIMLRGRHVRPPKVVRGRGGCRRRRRRRDYRGRVRRPAPAFWQSSAVTGWTRSSKQKGTSRRRS